MTKQSIRYLPLNTALENYNIIYEREYKTVFAERSTADAGVRNSAKGRVSQAWMDIRNAVSKAPPHEDNAEVVAHYKAQSDAFAKRVDALPPPAPKPSAWASLLKDAPVICAAVAHSKLNCPAGQVNKYRSPCGPYDCVPDLKKDMVALEQARNGTDTVLGMPKKTAMIAGGIGAGLLLLLALK